MTLSESEYASKSDNELFQAIEVKQWPLVENLLEEKPHLAAEPDVQGNMPLHIAIRSMCPDPLLLKLLDAYPDACKRHGAADCLPLHYAAMRGVSIMVMYALILAHPEGLDESAQNYLGTPRDYMEQFEHHRELLQYSMKDWERMQI